MNVLRSVLTLCGLLVCSISLAGLPSNPLTLSVTMSGLQNTTTVASDCQSDSHPTPPTFYLSAGGTPKQCTPDSGGSCTLSVTPSVSSNTTHLTFKVAPSHSTSTATHTITVTPATHSTTHTTTKTYPLCHYDKWQLISDSTLANLKSGFGETAVSYYCPLPVGYSKTFTERLGQFSSSSFRNSHMLKLGADSCPIPGSHPHYKVTGGCGTNNHNASPTFVANNSSTSFDYSNGYLTSALDDYANSNKCSLAGFKLKCPSGGGVGLDGWTYKINAATIYVKINSAKTHSVSTTTTTAGKPAVTRSISCPVDYLPDTANAVVKSIPFRMLAGGTHAKIHQDNVYEQMTCDREIGGPLSFQDADITGSIRRALLQACEHDSRQTLHINCSYAGSAHTISCTVPA